MMTGISEENEERNETVPDIESGILSGKLLDEDTSEKLDSGMDEEMNGMSPDAADLNSDSEDEPVVVRKKVKKPMVLNDDSDEDRDEAGSEKSSNIESKTAGEHISGCDDQGSTKTAKKKNVSEVLSAIMDSDSENETGPEKESQQNGGSSGSESDSLTDIIKKRKVKKQLSESPTQESSQKTSRIFNSELFDAEESDSGDDQPAQEDISDGQGGESDDEDNADDEGFSDDIDPKLRAKLLKMKGASKEPRKGKDRKAKPKADSLMDLHSESQRLIRESQVVLPYHQPTPRPLNDFLARATKKQQDYKALKAVREFKKPSVVQHVIANCSPAVLSSPSQPRASPAHAPLSDQSKRSVQVSDTVTDRDVRTEIDSRPEVDAVSKKIDFEDDELPDLDDSAVNKSQNIDGMNKTSSAQVLDQTEKTQKESERVVCQDEIMEVDGAVSDKTFCETSGNNVKACTTENPSNTPVNDERESDMIAYMTGTSKEESLSPTADDVGTPSVTKPLIKVLPELQNVTPRLSGGPEAFIDFEEESDTPKASGKEKLLDRFLKHSTKKQHKQPKDVDISIVEKESGPGETTELKLTSIKYHVTEEEDNRLKTLDKPGAKLLALKEELQSKMKVKREEARQKRQEIYALENEEGFEENEEEKILDDDAEMSDKSDTDIEDDQFDAEFGEEEFEEDEEEEEKVRNPFADDEADEDDDDFEPGEDALNKESDEDEIASDEEDGTMKLQLDTSGDDEDSDLENLSQNVRSSSKKKHKPVRKFNISDDEESNLPPAQSATRESGTGSFKMPNGLSPNNLDDDDELSPLSKHLAPTQTQNITRKSGLTLAVEDSQDLYGNSVEPFTTMTYPAGDTQQSQSLNFIVEDSQSQMLDADGFLKVKSTTKKPTSASLGLKNISNTQDNMSELMGLCSGRFVDPCNDDGKKTSAKQLFSDTSNSIASTQGQVSDELLGLCSGFFPNDGTQKPKSQGLKRKLEDNDESNESFTLLSDEDNHMDSDKDELDENNEDNNFDEVDGDASCDSAVQTKKKFRGFRGKITGRMRKEFVDEEAELSGSEFDSDEDLDLAEEDDIMEMEEGDRDVTLTEEELRNQVGRAHLKETIDSDKREIMRLQEMYLPDGDLYSDGNGRMRRFRWKNMDDESQQDMFDGEGSDEDAPEEDADELRWRMERFEREKFLQEERDKEENETGSQFFNLGKKFTLKIKEPAAKSTEKVFKKPQTSDKKENTSPVKPILKPASKRKGSFLTRGKEALAKIAERTKSNVNPNATRNSRNFVFQHVSPEKSDAAPQPKPVSKPTGAKKKTSVQPLAKRQRTKTDEKPGSSIFNILER